MKNYYIDTGSSAIKTCIEQEAEYLKRAASLEKNKNYRSKRFESDKMRL